MQLFNGCTNHQPVDEASLSNWKTLIFSCRKLCCRKKIQIWLENFFVSRCNLHITRLEPRVELYVNYNGERKRFPTKNLFFFLQQNFRQEKLIFFMTIFLPSNSRLALCIHKFPASNSIYKNMKTQG